MFAGVGERTREGNDLYKEMIESVSGPERTVLPAKHASTGSFVNVTLRVTLT